ncbi:Glycogen phosphorylase [Fulvivirga imtechensis AK7]|uniref:Glycogen phosphorylase n=1 Tax=Fulvivirga imtechensis AK7 TaxID=1237149 RepID=L8JRU3_9BACT|nr:alpha-glucan family phosphorylase [Fulvivirga imtechensis]ELR71681.1 Glycogen phosphorylase [Fulvivirga imtechensis AK7]
MSQKRFFQDQLYGFLPTDIDGLDMLIELALDIRWSWNHAADKIWKHLDPALWELTHNPWIVLQTVSRNQLERQLADPAFKRRIRELIAEREQEAIATTWFQQNHTHAPLTCVAYFSMEFMLTEALTIYSGGLGNVAGDQLKSASDLGVPVVGVGLLYQQGYFRQGLDQNGDQLAMFPYNEPGQLPLTPLRLPDGEWLRLKIDLPGYPVWLRTWQVQVGRARLYLLDSNDAANLPVHRGITSELYGDGIDTRIKQEIILGIGGWKLLRALGLKPEVCHINEGHTALVILERASDYMKEAGVSFEEALAVTRAGNHFTTHTTLSSSFDRFNAATIEQFLGSYARHDLGISLNRLMGLGRETAGNENEPFNMGYLAFRGCGAVNGVSRLHGEVSRRLFEPIFPRWPTPEVPVGSVTNGVHMPAWDSELADNLWTKTCGKERWKGTLDTLEQDICCLSDEALWQFRNQSRDKLVSFIRERWERQLNISGYPTEMVEMAKRVFNPKVLTLGFARRFVPYKRTNLLLHNPQRLIHLLTNEQRPVQLVVAGKAPPRDPAGKSLIRQWIQFIQQYHLYDHVIFLSDHDIFLTEQLVRGVDVWINTPRYPMEASGTSGMKVLVNGGINLSVLDGWWAEAYSPEVGWAIGDGKQYGDDVDQDATDANALYNLLEHEVIPEFYERNAADIPERWVKKMRRSMATLTPRFSSNRTVREYTEKYYLPMAERYLQRAANRGEQGIRIANVQAELNNRWYGLSFIDVKATAIANGYLFHASVFFNGIDPEKVCVEVFANEERGEEPVRVKMTGQPHEQYHEFSVEITTKRAVSDYTVRIVPAYENISVPLENNLILWQR